MKVIIMSILLLSIGIILMSVRILFIKGGRFPSSHVSANKSLRDKGITCHTSQHNEAQKKRDLNSIYKNLN